MVPTDGVNADSDDDMDHFALDDMLGFAAVVEAQVGQKGTREY